MVRRSKKTKEEKVLQGHTAIADGIKNHQQSDKAKNIDRNNRDMRKVDEIFSHVDKDARGVGGR